jgi:trehalose utilization protein
MTRLALLMGFLVISSAIAADPVPLKLEENPTDKTGTKVVLIVGSNYFKAGEHDYLAAARVLADLLKQTPNVVPVVAADWPKKPETLQDAKAVLFLFDGAEKHGLVKQNRLADIQKLADSGTGLVFLHQTLDISKDLGDRFRGLSGAAWEKSYSQRAHWITTFDKFPAHPIFNGVKPFKIDDGWLFKLRFAKEEAQISPLLRTVSPKAKDKPGPLEDVVAWTYERPQQGRSFSFTGAHLHGSFAEEGYRRFLVNGILWAAKVEIPEAGAPVKLDAEQLPKYLTPAPKK